MDMWYEASDNLLYNVLRNKIPYDDRDLFMKEIDDYDKYLKSPERQKMLQEMRLKKKTRIIKKSI